MTDVSDLVERLFASDAASALTNEAARRIEYLERYVQLIELARDTMEEEVERLTSELKRILTGNTSARP